MLGYGGNCGQYGSMHYFFFHSIPLKNRVIWTGEISARALTRSIVFTDGCILLAAHCVWWPLVYSSVRARREHLMVVCDVLYWLHDDSELAEMKTGRIDNDVDEGG